MIGGSRSRDCIALLVAALVTGAAYSVAVIRPAQNPLATAIDGAAQNFDAGDCDEAMSAIGEVSSSPEFTTLSGHLKVVFYQIRTACFANANKPAQAYTDALAGTRLNEASDALWRMRLQLELWLGRPIDAVTTIEAILDRRSDVLNAVPVEWMLQLDTGLKQTNHEPERARLLAILSGPHYAPDRPVAPVDIFRSHYAELLIERGDFATAAAVVRRIDDPAVLMRFSLDRRFRAIIPSGFDARAATERDLQRVRDAAVRYPNSLIPINDAAIDLLALGRPEEALAILQTADPANPSAPKYADPEDRVWWWDQLADTYLALDRYQDAVTAYEYGAVLDEHGNPNVSQLINLAETQATYGHADDALRSLARLPSDPKMFSLYGEVQRVKVRACIGLRQGNDGAAASDIAFVKQHFDDAPSALSDLYICADRPNEAAAAFIARLASPKAQAAALRELSTFNPQPHGLPPSPARARINKLLLRPDLQAALARAGGAGVFNLSDQPL